MSYVLEMVHCVQLRRCCEALRRGGQCNNIIQQMNEHRACCAGQGCWDAMGVYAELQTACEVDGRPECTSRISATGSTPTTMYANMLPVSFDCLNASALAAAKQDVLQDAHSSISPIAAFRCSGTGGHLFGSNLPARSLFILFRAIGAVRATW